MFVVPSWAAVEHPADEQADLFVAATRRCCGHWASREQVLSGPAGRDRRRSPPLNRGDLTMKLALFDDNRLGVVLDADGTGVDASVVDVTDALPWPHDPDPLTAGWWRALCRDFGRGRARRWRAAAAGQRRAARGGRLRAPALAPSKVVAAASNYGDHVAEMHGVQERTLGRVEAWMMEFDVFLKSPSSIVGPGADIVLPPRSSPPGTRSTTSRSWSSSIGTGRQGHPAGEADGPRARVHGRAGHHRPSAPPTAPAQELRHLQPAGAVDRDHGRGRRRIGSGHPADLTAARCASR